MAQCKRSLHEQQVRRPGKSDGAALRLSQCSSQKVKLPAPRGGGSAVRQCFAARKGKNLFQIASLNPALKGGLAGKQTGQELKGGLCKPGA
jgi:hypothetical protein